VLCHLVTHVPRYPGYTDTASACWSSIQLSPPGCDAVPNQLGQSTPMLAHMVLVPCQQCS
jgi:hypothetical protein